MNSQYRTQLTEKNLKRYYINEDSVSSGVMNHWPHSIHRASAVRPSTRTNDQINWPNGRPIRRAQADPQKMK